MGGVGAGVDVASAGTVVIVVAGMVLRGRLVDNGRCVDAVVDEAFIVASVVKFVDNDTAGVVDVPKVEIGSDDAGEVEFPGGQRD